MTRAATCDLIALILSVLLLSACGTAQKKDREFFTSGSHEADQRADQRMAKAEQLNGGGNTANPLLPGTRTKKSLYERLGGDSGIRTIVDDYVPRVLDDPRVNWKRNGVIYGGFSIHHNKSMYWNANPDQVKALKDHMAQFIALATGGPAQYQGREIGAVHHKMHINNAEFDASVGDLKATLDKLQVPTDEQKELLSIVESTRAQIAEER